MFEKKKKKKKIYHFASALFSKDMLRIVKGFAPWILFEMFEGKVSISIGVPGGPLGFMRLIRVGILQRVCFSLRSRAIRPLADFGARRENVLRGAGYAWTPGLRVFDNSKR